MREKKVQSCEDVYLHISSKDARPLCFLKESLDVSRHQDKLRFVVALAKSQRNRGLLEHTR